MKEACAMAIWQTPVIETEPVGLEVTMYLTAED
ncbi:MAG: pyrroloquinoline quinone precursor peptide PqqA [Geminicoccaceae bacterium]|nr:pyrroloquinoline quinone precursor peptide PqqA [Geminicoccaceae bacterium]